MITRRRVMEKMMIAMMAMAVSTVMKALPAVCA